MSPPKSTAFWICGRCARAVIRGPQFGRFSNRKGAAGQKERDIVRWRHNAYNPECEEPPPLVIRNRPEG